MALPQFSIILPVRNGASFLREALNSALAQTYPPMEIVISDNASADETPKICSQFAARYPQICYRRSECLLPVGANWNRACRIASGEWLKLQGHDDMLHPDCLERIADELQRQPTEWVRSLALIGTGEEWQFSNGARYRESVVPGHHSISFEPGAYVRAWTRGATAVPLPGMVTATIRRNVFDEQGFPEEFCHCDTFFYLRLCSRSRYLYIPKPLVVNRIQQQSVTRTLAQGRLTVREHQQFFHQFLKDEGRALQLDFLSRVRLRFKPSANAASQFAINGLLCGRHRKAWDAVSCVPIWQWPLLPVLVLRAWHRERGRMRPAGVPAHIFFH